MVCWLRLLFDINFEIELGVQGEVKAKKMHLKTQKCMFYNSKFLGTLLQGSELSTVVPIHARPFLALKQSAKTFGFLLF